MNRWHWASLLLAVCLSGCASLPGATTDTVDGRTVEYVQAGQGTPVVVFENGLGARLDWWAKVWPDTVAETRALAYHRAGYGRSDASPQPREGAQVVQELRALLRARQLPPPYVLVGHSLGGLYMQLFARQHPQEVAALVLVDSTHPRQQVGAGAIENQSLLVRGVAKALITGTAKDEFDLVNQTGQQVLALPTVTGLPVTVLSAAQPMKETSDLAKFSNALREDIARLYPNAKQVWVDSGHAIPLEKPEAVVNAITAALAEARAGR